ncbi:MAG: glycosyltransferase family 2 protein [Tannerella sp.]|jgi:GT2 family glycosyltransferase|nr:glycosyltransferase family 2 protein [Tannerella sp.]
MDTNKKLAVIILNWNGKKLLEQFLPSIVSCSPEEKADIIVADNGSTDDSIAFLRQTFPSVGVLPLGKNYGFAEGYDRAIEAVEAEYIVLLNSDVEVTPGWLEAPLALLESDEHIACVQPKLLDWKDKGRFEYAGAAGGFIDRFGYPFCRGRLLGAVEEDRGQYDTEADLLWGSGACLFVRRSIFLKEGGLDAGFFAHQEEVEMCWRLRCRGYRILFTPRSTVYHVGGATLQASNPHKTFLNFRNSLLMIYKNLPEAYLRPALRVRFFLDYVAALKFLLAGQRGDARAVVRARRAFRDLRKTYLPVREENLRKALVPVPPELFKKSLVLSFYLHGRKTFAALRPPYLKGEGRLQRSTGNLQQVGKS